ncbi:MAG: BatD family protein [Candidatus Riflebacteria bacterium]|nr:BatD family protein [Candidatus Riflebacteria bacterium]
MKSNFFSRLVSAALIFLILSTASLYSQGMTFDADVDKTEVRAGETLRLTLTLTRKINGSNYSGMNFPEITSIPDFDIVGQRSSQNLSYVNGVGVAQVQVLIELVPQKPGDLTIPSLTLKDPSGAVVSTKAIKIKAHPPKNDDEEEAAPEKAAEGNPPEKTGIGFFQGLMILVFIIILVVGSPIVLSFFMTRGSKASNKWKEHEDSEKSTYSHGSSKIADTKISDAKIVDAKIVDKNSNFDFETELAHLKRNHPDPDREMYKKFFEIFHTAIVSSSGRFDPAMTPDELMNIITRKLPASFNANVKTLFEDWEVCVFANQNPQRSFADVIKDAREILSGIKNME